MRQKFIVRSKEVKKNALDAVMACTGDKIKAVTVEDYVPDKTREQRAFFHVLLQVLGDEIKIILKLRTCTFTWTRLGTAINDFSFSVNDPLPDLPKFLRNG